jgi:hypothetical protein
LVNQIDTRGAPRFRAFAGFWPTRFLDFVVNALARKIIIILSDYSYIVTCTLAAVNAITVSFKYLRQKQSQNFSMFDVLIPISSYSFFFLYFKKPSYLFFVLMAINAYYYIQSFVWTPLVFSLRSGLGYPVA